MDAENSKLASFNVLAAGRWLDQSLANRTKAVKIAARPRFFDPDVTVLEFVIENAPESVFRNASAERVTLGT